VELEKITADGRSQSPNTDTRGNLVTCKAGSNFSRKDAVSVNCWVSTVMGNSAWRTDPRKPSSAVNPGDGLHLSLADKVDENPK